MLIAKMPLQHLIDAINWTAPSASTDPYVPYSGIRFTVGKSNPAVWNKDWEKQELPGVSLTSTDRYRMSWSVIPDDSGNLGSGEFVIPVKELTNAMKSWPKKSARRPLTHTVSIVVENDATTVEITIHDGLTPTLRQNLPLLIDTTPFPKCNGLIPEAKVGHPSFGVNPSFLKSFGDACVKVSGKETTLRVSMAGKSTREMMCFAPNADDTPVRHSGLLMTVRIGK